VCTRLNKKQIDKETKVITFNFCFEKATTCKSLLIDLLVIKVVAVSKQKVITKFAYRFVGNKSCFKTESNN